MKKIFFAAFFLIFSTMVFPLGAGVQLSGIPSIIKPINENDASTTFSFGESVNGTFKMERIPIVISGGIDLFYYDDRFDFGLNISGDYLFFLKTKS